MVLRLPPLPATSPSLIWRLDHRAGNGILIEGSPPGEMHHKGPPCFPPWGRRQCACLDEFFGRSRFHPLYEFGREIRSDVRSPGGDKELIAFDAQRQKVRN